MRTNSGYQARRPEHMRRQRQAGAEALRRPRDGGTAETGHHGVQPNAEPRPESIIATRPPTAPEAAPAPVETPPWTPPPGFPDAVIHPGPSGLRWGPGPLAIATLLGTLSWPASSAAYKAVAALPAAAERQPFPWDDPLRVVSLLVLTALASTSVWALWSLSRPPRE